MFFYLIAINSSSVSSINTTALNFKYYPCQILQQVFKLIAQWTADLTPHRLLLFIIVELAVKHRPWALLPEISRVTNAFIIKCYHTKVFQILYFFSSKRLKFWYDEWFCLNSWKQSNIMKVKLCIQLLHIKIYYLQIKLTIKQPIWLMVTVLHTHRQAENVNAELLK